MNGVFHINSDADLDDIKDAIIEKIFKAQAITSGLITSIETSDLNNKPFYGVALALEDYLDEINYLFVKLNSMTKSVNINK